MRRFFISFSVADDDTPFSMKNLLKNIPEDQKKWIEKSKERELYPKKFKCKNDTGIFEAAIYLDNYYRVVIDVFVVTKQFVISDFQGFEIHKNGEVFYKYDPYGHGMIKISTGFVLDEDKRDQMLDFIKEMNTFSKHLREKYYKNK
ncbi:MAG: hypothetical protein IJA31_02090 [Clostridia bacterium]|nr:hypothetical protein [Clostridia bacterium]